MLSGKKIFPLLMLLLVIEGCGTKEGNETPQGNSAENSAMIKGRIKDVIGADAQFVLNGKFADDSLTDFAAGSEVMNKKEWGIRFYLLNYKNGQVQKRYETPLLNGSFKECKVDKIRFTNSDHDFIYYNSLNYFMGSGGGEVLAYIIDLKGQIVYYSHLVTEPEGRVELYVSNAGNNEILKFFTDVFKKDYPSLRLTAKDPVLD